jgi:uncharacterized protein (DUF2384 family)
MSAMQSHMEAMQQKPVGPAAMRTFFRIAEAWELTSEEQRTLLGIPAASTFYKWRKTPPARLSPDLLERLSYIFGIYKALQILLPDARLADAWLSRPNLHPLFGGRAPKERMLSGRVADLYVVRKHLDGVRGG